jgi:hypothetical protein
MQGISAAGYTTPEVPTVSSTSQLAAASIAAVRAASGRASPNHTTPGRTSAPQRVQRRRHSAAFPRVGALVLFGVRKGSQVGGVCHAAGREEAAVQVDRSPGPGPLVQVVDVPGDDGAAGNHGRVSGIGLRPAHPRAATRTSPRPDLDRVKCLRGGQPLGVEAGPEPCEIVTEGRHAALGGDAGASEDDNPASLGEELSGTGRERTFDPANPALSLVRRLRHFNTSPPGRLLRGDEQLR